MNQRGSARFVSLVTTMVVLAVVAFGFFQRQAIFDWYRLRGYQPPAAIAQLATDTTMNDSSRRLFYVYAPELDDKVSFANHCTGDEKTIVLGCYVSGRGIYLYDVTDERLNGVEQVTAAHEMLHAAYDRLSSRDRAKVDSLTAQAYEQLTDQRVKDTIDQYRSKDPSVVPNEMHSILATEVANLPTELESYYKRYFNDRSKIVAFSAQYESAFTSRKKQVAQYDTQLTTLKKEVEMAEVSLDKQNQSLASERKRLDALATAGNISAYNAGVDAFNASVRAYNNLIASTQAKIDQYNKIVNERNAIALEEQSLAKSLDSRLQSQPTE